MPMQIRELFTIINNNENPAVFIETLERQLVELENERRRARATRQTGDARRRPNNAILQERDGNQEDEEMVTFLNQPDESGNTLLHRAAFHGSFALVELLIGLGLDIGQRNTAGQSAVQVIPAGNPDYTRIHALLTTRDRWTGFARGYNINRVIHMLQQVEPEIEPGRNKNKVLFIGPSGSGKSTFLNSRFGAEYEIHYAGGCRPEARLVAGVETVQTGFGINSTTLFPYVKERQGNAFVYCDLAGLFDRRGHEHRIVAASSTQCLTLMPGQIQGILVFIDIPSLTGNLAASLRETAKSLHSICREDQTLLQSVRYVITKVMPHHFNEGISVETITEEFLERIYQAAERERDPAVQFMLGHMIDNPNFIELNDLTTTAGDRIDRLFTNTVPVTGDRLNFMLHDNAQRNFREFLLDLPTEYLRLKQRIATDIPHEIRRLEQDNERLTALIPRSENDIVNARAQLNGPLVEADREARIANLELRIQAIRDEIIRQDNEKTRLDRLIATDSGALNAKDTPSRHLVETSERGLYSRNQHREVTIEYRFGAPVIRMDSQYSGYGALSTELRYPHSTREQFVDTDGALVDLVRDPEGAGRYHRIFRASEGVSSCSVRFYAENRYLPENREAIPRLRQTIATNTTQLATVNRTLANLRRQEPIIATEIRDLRDERVRNQTEQRALLNTRIHELEQLLAQARQQLITNQQTIVTLRAELAALTLEISVNRGLFTIVRKITADLNIQNINTAEFQRQVDADNLGQNGARAQLPSTNGYQRNAVFGNSRRDHQVRPAADNPQAATTHRI